MAQAPKRAMHPGFLVLWVLLASVLASGVTTCMYQAFSPRERAPEATTVVRGTSTVVAAIRDLARLETTSFHMERVIDVRDRQAHLFGMFESEDVVLLVAAADIVAGIDLTMMGDGDIRQHEGATRSIELLLPAPVILSARLDNDRTYVHTRATDPLAVRAKTLETRARQEAERALRDAALEAGILARARSNAEQTMRTLLQGLGFERVVISFKPSAEL